MQRTIRQHNLNANSSRAHTIFTLHIESRSRVESADKVVFSKLHLVDLAGSEMTKKTGSEGLVLEESCFINKSLSFLEQVVADDSHGSLRSTQPIARRSSRQKPSPASLSTVASMPSATPSFNNSFFQNMSVGMHGSVPNFWEAQSTQAIASRMYCAEYTGIRDTCTAEFRQLLHRAHVSFGG